MKRCERCGKWFHESDSAVCNPCWEDMGQMPLDFEDEGAAHPIDTIFDRDRELYGKDW
jgi:hypothetical protein